MKLSKKKAIDKIKESNLDKKAKSFLVKSIERYGYHKPLIMIRRVSWEITSKCNMNCIHCSASANDESHKDLTFKEIEIVLNKLKELGIESINFSGGELFMRKDMLDIFRKTVELGFRFSFASNLSLINEKIIDFLNKNRPNAIQTSLDFSNPLKYNQFRKLNNAFDAFMKGYSLIKSRTTIPVIATCTVTKSNYNELDKIIDFAVENKFDGFTFNDLIPIGRAKDISDIVLSNEEFAELMRYAREKKELLKGKINIQWEGVKIPDRKPDKQIDLLKSKCIACFERINIDSDGSIQPCNLMKLKVGNILHQEFKDIWDSSEIIADLLDREKLTGKCGNCNYKYSCGGCRARAFAYYNDYHAEDPRCFS